MDTNFLKGLMRTKPADVVVAVDKAAADGQQLPAEAWKLRGQAFNAVLHPAPESVEEVSTTKKSGKVAKVAGPIRFIPNRRGG